MPRVIKLPEELAHKLDRLAGAEQKPRASYLVHVLWRDARFESAILSRNGKFFAN
jgi:hypothetical protein